MSEVEPRIGPRRPSEARGPSEVEPRIGPRRPSEARGPSGARPRIRIGSRPSTLARVQADGVAERLRAAGYQTEMVSISTKGDRSSAPLTTLGTGIFVSAVRDALAAGDCDVVVHSYKDLPSAPDPRLTLAAIPQREDPRDALVASGGRVLGELPRGCRVGTGSPRRTAQLHALGLGLEVVPIRGNVETRIGKVRSGEVDAVILAAAGLRRLGLVGEADELLDPLQMLPAPAQGALAVECRAADAELARSLAELLDDPLARATVTAERAVLATLEADCYLPIAAHADVVSDLDDDGRAVDRLSLRAVLGVSVGRAERGDPAERGRESGTVGRAERGDPAERGRESGTVGRAERGDPAERGRESDTGEVSRGALLRASATGEMDAAEKLGAALAHELLDQGADTQAPTYQELNNES